MADRESLSPHIRLDIQQLQLEARHRWLRAVEVCEILRNYHEFQISSEPPNQPSSGSLFLFDRKALRYFRKDGHNWRKRRDGKTANEAHEKLKVGSVDMLNCYYAHGEDNDCFQRRCYWLLEEKFSHIVLVHYLKVKGSRSSIRDNEPLLSNSQISNSVTSSVSNSYNEAFNGNAGSPSAVSSLTSSYEEIESEDHQAISNYPSRFNYPHVENGFENNKMGTLLDCMPAYCGGQFPGLNHVSLSEQTGTSDDNQFKTLDLASWEEVFQQSTGDSGNFSHFLDADFGISYSTTEESIAPCFPNINPYELPSCEIQDGTNICINAKQPLVSNIITGEVLQKVDSFSKWMSKELDGVEGLNSKSSSNLSWQNIETTSDVDDPSIDNYSMSPSIGQDQLFDIQDFSPSCSSIDTQTKVVITGKFLVNRSEVFNYNWAVMFGEIEVPAFILGNGILSCYAPSHTPGRVPFYVTSSNRFACSQVREFEFLKESQNSNNINDCVNTFNEKQLSLQLQNLLSLRSPQNFDSTSKSFRKKELIFRKIVLSMEGELCLGVDQNLKEKVASWLFQKVCEDGKGPNIVDEQGQGLLHLAAVLGFNWIIPPTLAAGVSVNFRDVNGWTALHWAAFYGREKTVALLIALEAASGALTDPSPEFPLGRTAADLASANGYKGISGFLAEHSLTAHLETLTMSDHNTNTPLQHSLSKAIQTMREKVATPSNESDYGSDPSLKDSLAAVRNATQAAGRIHQVFRMQSFQRKHASVGVDDDDDEKFLSFVSSKIQRHGHVDEQAHSAAIRIQKKFRGYKKRKEFLTFRERVVKIQAHVRGHQVRKRYKTVVWSVGILEKVILRWRRRGTGLRGFRPETLNKMSPAQGTQVAEKRTCEEEDDYDYLKEGRKQTEERLQKALVRVKSMVQYPEGRAQYRRLLTAVEAFHKNEQVHDKSLNYSENVLVEGEEDMIDVECLLDDDNFMAIAFE